MDIYKFQCKILKQDIYEQIKTVFTIDGYSKFMKESQYGAHRDVAVKILKDNLFFGVGVKNFRHESLKDKYENKEYLQTHKRYATHPHQVHHEMLSETGFFGLSIFVYIFFLLSIALAINNYLKILKHISAFRYNLRYYKPCTHFTLWKLFFNLFWWNFLVKLCNNVCLH